MRIARSLALLALAGGTLLAVRGAAAPGSRLSRETSPYLLQHAANPVEWYPWGPEAFEAARRTGKPVFLSVGYSACHWCHVMARESFEDEETARLLNDVCIPIKVDREERPDVDDLYMTAVQLQTGSGGWPMSVFMTPEARPFLGATYIRKGDFQKLLREVKEAWNDPKRRKDLEKDAERLSSAIGNLTARPPTPGTITPAVLNQAVRTYLEQHDEKNGGFGEAPKFPPSTRLAVLLQAGKKAPASDAKRAERAVALTLERMAHGGLYDQVGGGFHRYTVDARWQVPHFEKMLYDNALLAWIYLEAHRETSRPLYRKIGVETLDFVLRELRDPRGGFWSTLNAESPDPQGKNAEGAFYLWTPAEVQAVLGPRDGPLFCKVYGITDRGNFEGRNIPTLAKSREEWARELKTDAATLESRLDAMRQKLRAAREKRPRPSLDDKVLTSWNGLMIRALALGYDVTGEVRYRDAATAAADFLLTTLREEKGRLRRSYRAGRTQPQAFLEDYSFLTVGLLDLHRATGDERWLKEARALCGQMIADYWDDQGGTFWTTPHHHEPLLARLNYAEDQATPSGQSMAALAMIRLGRMEKDAALRSRAERMLNTYAVEMRRVPQAMSNMLLAAGLWFTAEDQAVAAAQPGGVPTLPGEKPKTVSARLEGVPKKIAAGQTLEVTVRLTVAEGWHINSDKPADELLVPTKLEALAPFKQVAVTYPAPHVVQLGISEQPASVFDGTVVLKIKVKAEAAVAKAKELRLRLRYQACNDEVCQIPTTLNLSAPINR